jgi:hypothetical protein
MVKCDHCNIENEENATHCQNCGKKININTNNTNIDKNINKAILIGLGILGILVLVGVILIFSNTSVVSGISEFDKSLLTSVKNGESSDSLISKIKDYSNINRQNSKTGYDELVSGIQSNDNATFLTDAKNNYDKELAYIQKIEDLQIKFANREINEETFIKDINKLYSEKPDLDF